MNKLKKKENEFFSSRCHQVLSVSHPFPTLPGDIAQPPFTTDVRFYLAAHSQRSCPLFRHHLEKSHSLPTSRDVRFLSARVVTGFEMMADSPQDGC